MALKTCITNYSFNRSLRGGTMDVEGFCDFCGKAGFDVSAALLRANTLDDDTDTLPPCPKCDGTEFDKVG